MILALGPKDLLGVIINRTSIASLSSSTFLGFCLFYSMNLSDPLTKSGLKNFIDMIFGIPIAIPFLIGFSGGDAVGYIAFGIELIIMILIVRLLIPKRLITNIKERIKKRCTTTAHTP